MKITFCGAARIVTGSCYLIETKSKKFLIDCGLFQGKKEVTRRNYEPFLFKPKEIDFVLLTHAHIDHSGLLPKLCKEGFKGTVFATGATVDLCEIMLEDSAGLQQLDTLHENKKRKRKGLPPREPLYDEHDVKALMPLFKRMKYDKTYDLDSSIKVRFKDAGHIIGSAIIEVYVTEKDTTKKLVFSGDIGQWDVPIVEDPTLIDRADYVLIESTYGDRLHEELNFRDDLLLKYVKREFKKGRKLLIPSFAIERTQELLYSFNKMIHEGTFPKEKIFLDSPLAIKATEIFKRHRECFDEEALNKYKTPFTFPNLVYCISTEESIQLNSYDKPCIIIAGSGMCTGGRIRHHIRHNISHSGNAMLFVGYQAEGTLGRVILEGAKTIRMMGMELSVKAEIFKINSFSAHADYEELIRWSRGFTRKPKKLFIVHGEEKSSVSLKEKLEQEGFDCHIPSIGESIRL